MFWFPYGKRDLKRGGFAWASLKRLPTRNRKGRTKAPAFRSEKKYAWNCVGTAQGKFLIPDFASSLFTSPPTLAKPPLPLCFSPRSISVIRRGKVNFFFHFLFLHFLFFAVLLCFSFSQIILCFSLDGLRGHADSMDPNVCVLCGPFICLVSVWLHGHL